MKQKAVVIKTDGLLAGVSVLREDACASCAGRHVCGGAKKFDTTVKNPLGAKAGDVVEIEADSGSVLLYAALVFLMPVVLSVTLYLSLNPVNALLSYISAALGFVLPFIVALIVNKRTEGKTLPVITAILPAGEDDPPCGEEKTE